MARADAVRTADNQCNKTILSNECHSAKHSQSSRLVNSTYAKHCYMSNIWLRLFEYM